MQFPSKEINNNIVIDSIMITQPTPLNTFNAYPLGFNEFLMRCIREYLVFNCHSICIKYLKGIHGSIFNFHLFEKKFRLKTKILKINFNSRIYEQIIQNTSYILTYLALEICTSSCFNSKRCC